MTNLWISAGIELVEGRDLAETRDALRELVSLTRQEPGCLAFDILEDNEKPGRFTLWEHWTEADALSAHFETPHTRAYLARDLTRVNYIERLSRLPDLAGAAD